MNIFHNIVTFDYNRLTFLTKSGKLFVSRNKEGSGFSMDFPSNKYVSKYNYGK